MENRRHQRVACDIPVILQFGLAQSLEGRVVNYCAGGALLELDVNVTDLAAEQQLNLFSAFDISFISSEKQSLVVQAHIRRVEGLSLGVEFYQPSPNTLALIDQQIRSNTPVKAATASVTTEIQPNAAEVAKRVNEIREQFWQDLLKQFFETVKSRFINLAERSKDNQEQQAYFGALNALQPIEQNIFSDLRRLVRPEAVAGRIAAQHYDQTSVAQNEALEVLEKNVFEDWLDVQIIITSLEADYYSPLFALNQYYSQLYHQEVLASNNPVGPCVICHTFKQMMALDQDRSIQAAVYSSFRDILSTKLKKLYHDLQLVFIENGYTANQKIAVAANANHSEQKNTVVNTVAAYEPHNTFDAVQAFKQLQHFIAKDKPQAYTEDECFKLDEINDWFSRLTLDKKLLLAGSDQPLRQVFQDIIEANGQGLPEGKHVKSEQLDILDVIDDIFGLMGATGELEPEIKAWLKQLKVPLIEVALNESQFFDDQYHPARQVVEQLVHLGSVDRVSNKNLEKTVKKHILDIVEHYEQDHTTFSRVSEELTKLIARQEKAFQRNADRVAKVHEGQQKLQRAKRYVFDVLKGIVVGPAMPKLVLDLIEIGWKELLVGVCVREGEESTEFLEDASVLKTLVDWCKGESSYAFDIELEAPAILELVDSQLAVSSAGLAPTKPILHELKQIFYAGKKAELITIEESDLGFEFDRVGSRDKAEIPARIKEQGNDERWLERVHRMQVGDWVECRDKGGESKRMRLIWTGEDEFKFVFVNNHGMKEVEFDIDSLVEDLDSGDILFVDESDVSFVDKSLFNTVQTVYEQMVFKATHDPLTELVNRHEFEKIITRSLSKLLKSFSESALLYIDINQFSIVNNNYGNQMGDLLLQVVAQRLKQHVSKNDVVARIGGNEFAILVSDTNEEQAITMAESLRALINDESFLIHGEVITISVGVGLDMMSSNTQSVTALLKHANLACRSAKQRSTDSAVVYKVDDYDQFHQDEVMNWAGKVDDAIATNQLRVRCQKIAPVNNTEADEPHYEVLLGVTNEKGELTSPEDFIEAAEQFNRMPKVDRWVVESVFEWMEDNPDKISHMHGLSINLSGCSINDGRFLKFLLEKIESATVSAEKICFEVTETATISSLNYAVDFINEVKKTGCKFSLDDFGTGMASYEYLQKLPVDYLKIDGIFIKDIVSNEKNYAMVKSINELGHFLGKETIAEYVENDEILEVLKEIGVDHAQGYGIERPVLLSTI